MTEMSPLGTTGNLLPRHMTLPADKRIDVQQKQGRVVYGVEIKITDDAGQELARDGKAFGDVKVRRPWITRGYFKGAGGKELDDDSRFTTGQAATLQPDAQLQIPDPTQKIT